MSLELVKEGAESKVVGKVPDVRWNLKGITSSDQEELQEALETGYEPFSVVVQPVPAPQGKILDAGKPQFVMQTVIWLKQPVLLEKDESDEENDLIS